MSSNILMKYPELEDSYHYWLNKVSSTKGQTSIDYYSFKQSLDMEKKEIQLGTFHRNQFTQLSKGNDLASYIIVVSIINILLYKYYRSTTNAIIVPGLEKQKALSLLIVDINDNDTFRTLLNRTKNELQMIYQNDDFPLGSFLQDEFDQSIHNYSNIACLMQEPDERILNNENTNYVFQVSLDSEVKIQLSYDSLMEQNHVNMIVRHFKTVLDYVLQNADITVNAIDLLDDMDKRIAYNQHHGQATYNESITIPEIISDIAQKHPDQTALICHNQKWTYEEINARANQIAHFLRSEGIARDDLVGVYFDQSVDMVISILGVLKSGSAYVPLDLTHPDERIRHICEESDMKYVITENDTDRFKTYDIQSIHVDSANITNQKSSNPSVVNEPNDLAYIMFTSGSTGKPKGVMIEHRNVIRLLKNDSFEFEFKKEDVWSLFHSHCFDFSVWEIFGALFNGATLLIIPKAMTIDHNALWEYLNKHNVTIFSQTPHSFYQFMQTDKLNNQRLQALRYVVFGGEELQPEKLLSFYQKYPETNLINMYGITETTVHVTYKPITLEDMNNKHSNIGVPLSTLKVFILDENNNFLPVGIVGEICVGGSGLARGYLNNKELTDEKFFKSGSDILGKIYKTGDLGRFLPNGEIEYIGRKDFQVNVRGYRIELGEIELQLNNIAQIHETIVDTDENDNQEKQIVAYYVADNKIDYDSLRTKLKQILPDYMIPSQFHRVDYIPLNSNGKVHKQKLKQLIHENEKSGKKADEYAHQLLVDVWQDILGKDDVFIDDNFYEIGGDSIKAIQIIANLKRYHYDANVHDLLNNPTIEQFSSYLVNNSHDDSVNEEDMFGSYQLTPIQHEYFKEYQGEREAGYYNQAIMIYKKDGFNSRLVEQAFEKIMKHHDNLRTIFKEKPSGIEALVRSYQPKQFRFNEQNFTDAEDEDRRITESAIDIQSSLDIFKGPLVRLGLFKTVHGDHLLFAVHHLLIDGYSWRIILEDFHYIYEQLSKEEKITLPKKTTSFKEWSEKLYEYANGNMIKDSIPHWEDMTQSDKLFPIEDETVKNIVKNVSVKSIELDEHQAKLLLDDANYAYNTKPNEILITALGLAIRECFNRDTETISLESHGREHSFEYTDVSRTVGWFTSIYPFQIQTNNERVDQSIIMNKDNLRRVVPFSNDFLLNKHLNKNINKLNSFNQVPSISFNYLGEFDRETNTDLFSLSDISFGNVSDDFIRVPYQLDINCFVVNHKLRINMGFIKGAISEKLIETFSRVFYEKINECIEVCMQEQKQQTPSDFSYNELSLEDLGNIVNQVNEI